MNKLRAYLSLGANLGEREKTLAQALELLALTSNLRLTEVSSFYKTAPWGNAAQDDFVNAATELEFVGEPEELLAICQSIETKLGRVRHEKWGPRAIDIDIIHIVDHTQNSPVLTLPHPYFAERRFVLIPLAQIAPRLVIKDRSVTEYLTDCPDAGEVCFTPGSGRDFMLKPIACVDSNGGLGYGGKLLFRLPEDMEFFHAQTVGHNVIMGSRTAQSLPQGKPLPRRNNILLTRQTVPRPGFTVCHSLPELWAMLASLPRAAKNFVIGGAEIYNLLLPYADSVYLTEVASTRPADVFFPPLPDSFAPAEESSVISGNVGVSLKFCRYVRRW